MRLSNLLGKTMHQEPAEAEMASHRLLLKAGMIRWPPASIPTCPWHGAR